jgi:hypothetical protein
LRRPIRQWRQVLRLKRGLYKLANRPERQNLSMRMGIRRFTRLTNAFSKKLENHIHALSIYFMHYNFVRIHQSLRVTTAMEAGVTDRLWSLEDVVAIVDEWEASQKR